MSNTAASTVTHVMDVANTQVSPPLSVEEVKEKKTAPKKLNDKHYKYLAFAHWMIPQMQLTDVSHAHELFKFFAPNAEIAAFYDEFDANIKDHIAAYKEYQKVTKANAKPPSTTPRKRSAPKKNTVVLVQDPLVHDVPVDVVTDAVQNIVDAARIPVEVVAKKPRTKKVAIATEQVPVASVTDEPVPQVPQVPVASVTDEPVPQVPQVPVTSVTDEPVPQVPVAEKPKKVRAKAAVTSSSGRNGSRKQGQETTC